MADRPVLLSAPGPGYPPGDGFNAFGYPVPVDREAAAVDLLVEDFGVELHLAEGLIREVCGHVQRDNPNGALLALCSVVDLTGAYRALAYLCTG